MYMLYTVHAHVGSRFEDHVRGQVVRRRCACALACNVLVPPTPHDLEAAYHLWYGEDRPEALMRTRRATAKLHCPTSSSRLIHLYVNLRLGLNFDQACGR